jgi:hypothetical protein
MYEFENYKCKIVRIEYKISELPEVESASFFLRALIANPLIRKFFLSPLLAD